MFPESSVQAWHRHVTYDSTAPPSGQLRELKGAGTAGAFTVRFNVVDALSYKLESGFVQFHCESKQDKRAGLTAHSQRNTALLIRRNMNADVFGDIFQRDISQKSSFEIWWTMMDGLTFSLLVNWGMIDLKCKWRLWNTCSHPWLAMDISPWHPNTSSLEKTVGVGSRRASTIMSRTFTFTSVKPF